MLLFCLQDPGLLRRVRFHVSGRKKIERALGQTGRTVLQPSSFPQTIYHYQIVVQVYGVNANDVFVPVGKDL
jgi:hypothetical protein